MNISHFILCFFIIFNLNINIKAVYIFYPEVGLHYKFYRTPLQWYDAKLKCAEDQASLAMPRNQNESEVLIKIFNGFPNSLLPGLKYPDFTLLGFHDAFEESEFVTLKGEPIQYYFDKWWTSQPDNYLNEDCGSLHRQGLLNDLDCGTPSTFICQKSDVVYNRPKKILNEDPAYKCPDNIDKCYKVHKNPKKWADARTMCMAEGGNLAIIRNKAEEEFLVKLYNENKVKYVTYQNFISIGFHDLYREGHFTTVLDENLHDIGYVNWAPGQPDNYGEEDCGSMHENGGLNDLPCGTPNIFICERPAPAHSSAASDEEIVEMAQNENKKIRLTLIDLTIYNKNN